MKWDGDTPLGNMTRRGAQLALGMYTIHLFTGHTLFYKRIRADTIREYVKAAASFVTLFGVHVHDLRKDNPTNQQLGSVLSPIFKIIDKYEKMKNRREPFTPLMHDEAIRRAKACGCGDCLTCAMADWYTVGLGAGVRKSEWCQDIGNRSDPANPKLNIFGETAAFCLDDIRIETIDNRRYRGAACLKCPVDLVPKAWVCFRTQKNGNHGEERLFAPNTDNQDRSFVHALYRILLRFVRLRGPDDLTTPLAIYFDPETNDVSLITPDQTVPHMRELAATVYNLDPNKKSDKEILSRWSSHSLRVGACVLLHALGFTAEQIKWLLRWKSDTFLDYLRNTMSLANMQARVLDKAAAMPTTM